MTTEFDDLAKIRRVSLERPEVRSLTEWLADICVAEASNHKSQWTYEKWLQTKKATTIKTIHGEAALKWEFLDDTHDVLGHTGQYHSSVFKASTVCLIIYVNRLVHGQQIWKGELRNIRKYREQLLKILEEIGLEKDEYDHYKIRGIPETKTW